MKKETLNKANKLNEQVNKLNMVICTINNIIKIGETYENIIKIGETYEGNFFSKIRLLNMKHKDDKHEKATIILFDNQHMRGYMDIEVDKEFLEYLSKYFENKKDELEIELENL